MFIKIVHLYIFMMCVIGFFQMLIDKKKARKHNWRISERSLLLTAALGGAIGSWIGMYVFRHKTRHTKFVVFVPIFVVIHIGLLVLLTLYVS